MIAGTLGAQESEINDFAITNTGCGQRRALLAIDWHISFTLKQSPATSALGSSENQIAKSAVAALSNPAFEIQVLVVAGVALEVDVESFTTEDATRDEPSEPTTTTKSSSTTLLVVVGVVLWAVATAVVFKGYFAPKSKKNTSGSQSLPTTNNVRQVSANGNGAEVHGPWVEMMEIRQAAETGAGQASIEQI